MDEEANAIYSKETCYHCGKQGHLLLICWSKTAKCHMCLKVEHLAKVYLSKQKSGVTRIP